MFDDLDWPLNASYGFSAIAVFLVYSNYGPILYTVSEINGDATFPAPCIYDPLRGFSLKFCNGDGARKKLENDALTRMSKKVRSYSHSFRHNTGLGETDMCM